jgi:PGF-pre-PGF domain-containing protein
MCCGNGICDSNESAEICPEDCSGSICGNNVCEAPNETFSNCCSDCHCPSEGQVCRNNQCINEGNRESNQGGNSIKQSKANYTGKYREITPNETVNFSIIDENISIEKINIEVNKTVRDIELKVVNLPENTTGIPAHIVGKVYEYFEVGLTNFTNDDIEKATIGFRVNKIWLDKNKINKTTVKLNRYFNTSWQVMPTDFIGESSSFVYYEAQIPGFSYFAITGEEIKTIPGTPNICTPNDKRCRNGNAEECNGNGTDWTILEICKNSCNDLTVKCNPQLTGDTSWIYAIILTMVLAILIVIYIVEKKSKKPKTLEEALEGIEPI